MGRLWFDNEDTVQLVLTALGHLEQAACEAHDEQLAQDLAAVKMRAILRTKRLDEQKNRL